MATYQWQLSMDNLIKVGRLLREAYWATKRRDRDEYERICEEVREVDGFPLEAHPDDDTINVVPKMGAVTLDMGASK